MILTIRKIGDPILMKPCRAIQNPLKYKRLIKDMYETARFHKAAGLAANQVGQSVQICLLGNGLGDYHVIINPKIVDFHYNKKEIGEESCLSIPKISVMVERFTKLTVNYLNHNGDQIEKVLEGFDARVFQHEEEHLSGKLMLETAEKIFYIK